LVFQTKEFTLPAFTLAELYRSAGKWNCSSNGSSSTYASRRFTGPRRSLSLFENADIAGIFRCPEHNSAPFSF